MAMTRDIDISLLRALIAVAETGSMTSAANTMNLTQGAISQKIKRLEAMFESTLFEREQRKLQLTPEGEKLISRAYRLVSLNDEIWQSMMRPEVKGKVKLGVPLDLVRPFLPSILRRFNRENPSIQITVVSNMTSVLLDALNQGEIDIAITTERQPASEQSNILLTDQLVWIGVQNGDACYKKPLPISLGSNTSAFRGTTIDALNKKNLDWIAVCDEGNLESTLVTVEADIAVAPYLSRLLPNSLEVIDKNVGLPDLPEFYINLHTSDTNGNWIKRELADAIRKGFSDLKSESAKLV